MTRRLPTLCFALAAASVPQIASAQSAEETSAQSVVLDPGLYDVSVVVTMGGNVLADVDVEDCIREGEGEGQRTLEDMISVFTDNEACPTSNSVWTASTVQADFKCGGSTGTIKAEFGADFLKTKINQTLNPGVEMQAKADMRRKSECPADWVKTE